MRGAICCPDLGCYEVRYRAGRAVQVLASALLAVGLGLLWHTPLIFTALTILLAVPAVLALVLRPVAFRADHAGIILGSDRLLRRRPAVFILGRTSRGSSFTRTAKLPGLATTSGPAERSSASESCAREGAPTLPYGDKQAPGCPVPGIAAGATRRVIQWRLDRERLAAVTAAVAPGIAVIEARNDPGRRIEGPGQRQDRQPRAV